MVLVYFSVETQCRKLSVTVKIYVFEGVGETATGTTIPDLPDKEKLYVDTHARITAERNTINTVKTSKAAKPEKQKQEAKKSALKRGKQPQNNL